MSGCHNPYDLTKQDSVTNKIEKLESSLQYVYKNLMDACKIIIELKDDIKYKEKKARDILSCCDDGKIYIDNLLESTPGRGVIRDQSGRWYYLCDKCL